MGVNLDDIISGVESGGDTRDAEAPTPSSGNAGKSQKRRKHKNIERFTIADVTATSAISPTSTGVKGKGRRRQHRLENVKYLLSLWNKDDEDCDVMMEDEPLQSIFSQVLTDDGNRKIWNNFSDLSGQEQDEYLAFIERSEYRRKRWTELTHAGLEPSGNPAFRTDVCNTTVAHRKICGDDLLFADLCYQRIERRLRAALNKKHVPLGMLEKLEIELTTFFMKWPSSKYTSVLSSSYERLLMHALCQYLGLLSQSVTQNGHRCTQVQAKSHSSFHPPGIPLCCYIKERL